MKNSAILNIVDGQIKDLKHYIISLESHIVEVNERAYSIELIGELNTALKQLEHLIDFKARYEYLTEEY